MLLFRIAKQIRRVADLRLHFLFAIAVVVVSDQGDDNTSFVLQVSLKATPSLYFSFGSFQHIESSR